MERKTGHRNLGLKPKVIVIILLCLIFLQAGSSMLAKSPTFDEVCHLGFGKYLLEGGKWDIATANFFHPPLSYYLHSIPLLFMQVDEGVWEVQSSSERGRRIIDHYPDDLVITLARIPMLLVSMLLGFYVFKWAKELYGTNAGLFALFFYTFSPNILAHSRLITAEITLTCFLFIATYYFWRAYKEPRKKNLMIAGITLGLALLSKFNSLLLLPIYLLLGVFIFYHSVNTKGYSESTPPNKFRTDLFRRIYTIYGRIVAMFLIGFIVVWVGYRFDAEPATSLEKRPHVAIDNILGNEHLRMGAYYVSENIPLPLATYIKGIILQRDVNKRGHPSFLMGEYSLKGWWYYYLVAFLIKVPIPLLIMLVLSTVLMIRKATVSGTINELFLIVPILFIFVFFSIFSNLNIGLRYMLPVFPFIYVMISRAVSVEMRKQKVFLIFILLLCIWYFASSLRIYPHYLAYFNEFVGGPGNGYRYLVDSNLDWGQDLKGLKKYMDREDVEWVLFSYFGSNDLSYYDIKYQYLPGVSITPENLLPPCNDEPSEVNRELIAISVSNLQGVYLRDKQMYSWLKRRDPIEKIGYTIFIYDITEDAEAHYNLGMIYRESGMLELSDYEFRKAMMIDPEIEKLE